MRQEFFLSVLLYKEGEDYVAHCLEFDLVNTTTESFETAYTELHDLVISYLNYAYESDNTDHLYNPAPAEYWNRFYKSVPYTIEFEYERGHIEVGGKSFRPKKSLYQSSCCINTVG